MAEADAGPTVVPDQKTDALHKDGWLWKKGEFRHNWTYRFVEIRGPFLYYFKIEKGIAGQPAKKTEKGVIPLIKTTVDSYFHKSRKATFQIKHPEGRIFVFDAEDEESKYAWMEAIGLARVEAVHKLNAYPYLKKLGLDSSATPAQIKKTYRKLALKNHPDKGGDQDLFLSLTEAYEVLMTLSDEIGGLGNLGEDGDPVTEIDTVVQRAPGKLGFGLTIARDDSMGDCVYVKNVTGITEMQGIVLIKDVISRIDGVAIQGMEYDEVLAKFKAIPTGSGVRLRLIRKEKQMNERRSSVEYAQPDYDQGYQYTPPEEEDTAPEVDEETQAKMDQEDDVEDDAEEITNRESWAPDVLGEDERSATGQEPDIDAIDENEAYEPEVQEEEEEDFKTKAKRRGSHFIGDLDSCTVLQEGEDVEVDVQLTAVGAQAVEDNQDLKNELAKLTMQIHAMEDAAEAKRQAEVEKEERIAKLEDQVRELSERLDSPGSTDSTQALDTKIADLQSENDGLLDRLTVTTDSYRDLETDHKKLQERLDGVIRALDEVIA
mmetsp:Transcript_15469/g.40892  ORF Transcript_15469/g.40892 Transcript_15469/m.40892 type:complete len:545 (-) Transcript_15469:104-1738(-)|eukprot:CAMPEP_0119480674 /NCGR_PEP_ID=MMETSP1344-20130328/9375_1 /TAXON_ID=236787 /ORGANISM="Florenciella parvula, Strain CCMP2471" /LENGTH=544 /DNA_ID=CAMNT_0007515005 /DNA_START=50 /DNA_END=1684 /DNA_ORIENTATION=-